MGIGSAGLNGVEGRDGLAALLAPRAIAIVGASADPSKMSGRPLANLRRFGFPGKIYPVNARHSEVQGMKAYASVADIGEPVDLTMVMTPAADSVDALRRGIEAGSKSFIFYSAGFAEYNEAGARLQHELAEIAKATRVRLLGPNCTGMINCHEQVCATFSTVVDQMAMSPGNLSFVGQSGAMAAYWLEKTLRAGLGFAKWISTGNEVDVSLADAIIDLAGDDVTKCICVYIEGTRDGPALRHAFEVALAAGKPVLVLRSGRTDEGKAAVASHTGAIAGESAVWRALFRQTGVIECGSLSEMVDVTKLFSRPPSGPVHRPLILSISGGAGAMATDAAVDAGLDVPPLPETLGDTLREILPGLGKLANPLDLTANATADYSLFRRTADAVVDDDSFDGFVFVLGLMDQGKDALPKIIADVMQRCRKPVIVVWMAASKAVNSALECHKIVAYEDIPEAFRSVAAWNRWHHARKQASGRPEPKRFARPMKGRALTEHAGQRVLGQIQSMRWPEATLVPDDTGLLDAPLPVKGPWVVKLQSGQMPHKTEFGGVAVDIRSKEALTDTVRRMAFLGARLGVVSDGILVQEMVPHVHELLVGLRTDPTFGPLLVIGRGGTEAEFERDMAIRLLPLAAADIKEMLGELRYADRLAGVRGRKSVDLDKLAQSIAALARRFEADKTIVEIEINPLALTSSGEIVPLDLLVTVAETDGVL